ncbi:MAG: hypothetical protein ACKVP4_01285 [Hyphomicrobium sp.]
MSAGMIGLIVGLFLGVVSWRTMNILSGRVEKAETKRLLGIVGQIELIFLPAIGYAIGVFLFEGQGAAP